MVTSLAKVKAVVSDAATVSDEECIAGMVAFLEAAVLLLQTDAGVALADLLHVVLPIYQVKGCANLRIVYWAHANAFLSCLLASTIS